MTPEELLQEWTQGEQTGMRPARVQAVRDDLMEHTDEYIPRAIPEIEALILNNPQKKGVITKRLKAAVEDEGD
jgi:hypothetical protein